MRKPTPAQAAFLRRALSGVVYVYRDPACPGGGVSERTLDAVSGLGWVKLGPYQALRGRRVIVTSAGRQMLERS